MQQKAKPVTDSETTQLAVDSGVQGNELAVCLSVNLLFGVRHVGKWSWTDVNLDLLESSEEVQTGAADP